MSFIALHLSAYSTTAAGHQDLWNWPQGSRRWVCVCTDASKSLRLPPDPTLLTCHASHCFRNKEAHFSDEAFFSWNVFLEKKLKMAFVAWQTSLTHQRVETQLIAKRMVFPSRLKATFFRHNSSCTLRCLRVVIGRQSTLTPKQSLTYVRRKIHHSSDFTFVLR